MNLNLAGKVKNVEGKRFAIQSFTFTKEMVAQLQFEALQDLSIHDKWDMRPGEYVRLYDKKLKECVMSDTPMEQRTNAEVLARARGHVLVAGLGLGMILRPMLENVNVKMVVVIEKYAEVIELNKRAGFDIGHPKLLILNADIFEWQPRSSFDVIYFDIWNNVGHTNKRGMDLLHERFAPHLKPGGWMESWRRVDCQRELSAETKAFYTKLIRSNPIAAAIIAGSLPERGFKCGGMKKT